MRASLQQRGERSFHVVNIRIKLFQSAPHFSSESNVFFSGNLRNSLSFQSAPHFSSEANKRQLKTDAASHRFKSAPHFSSEANILQEECGDDVTGLNPRLTSAARRTSS